MENKKRSKGVTLFAWSFIIISLIVLFSARGQKYPFISSAPILFLITFYTAAYGIAGILTGINLLRLKEWARKLVVFLAVLGVADMFIFVPLNHIDFKKTSQIELIGQQQLVALKNKLSDAYDGFLAKNNAAPKMSKEEFIQLGVTKVESITRMAMHIFMAIMESLLILYSIFLLYFFTRPRVKEQFPKTKPCCSCC